MCQIKEHTNPINPLNEQQRRLNAQNSDSSVQEDSQGFSKETPVQMEDQQKTFGGISFQSAVLTNDTGTVKTQSGEVHGVWHSFLLILWMLLAGCVFVLSLVMIFNPSLHEDMVDLALVGALAAAGIGYVFFVATNVTAKPKKIFWFGILFAGAAALLVYLPKFTEISFALVTGLLGIVIALTMLANTLRLRRDGAPYMRSLLSMIGYAVFAVWILVIPYSVRVFSVLTGMYLLILSLNVFWDGLESLFHIKPRAKGKVVVTLPTIIAALLPNALFHEINTLVKKEPEEILYLEEPDSGSEPDLIVYIHTRAGLLAGNGHSDVSFNGKVYSYGDYDKSSWHMGGFFADGVLALIPPQKQIEMALKISKKILVAYGLRLTPENKKAVQAQIDTIMAQTVPWKSEAERAADGEIPGDPTSFTDYGSMMYLEENAKLYKFKQGSRFKTYFGLGENCAEFAEYIIGRSGVGLVKMNGFITPGSLLEYLDELYLMGNTIVIDRRLYRLNDENGQPMHINVDKDKPITTGEIAL